MTFQRLRSLNITHNWDSDIPIPRITNNRQFILLRDAARVTNLDARCIIHIDMDDCCIPILKIALFANSIDAAVGL